MFKSKLIYKTDNTEYIENESEHDTLDDAIDEASEIAFSTTGFGLEAWQLLATFGEENKLYCLYPDEACRTTRYITKIYRDGS